MKTITSLHLIHAFGEAAEPALRVKQDEYFSLQTHDRFSSLLNGHSLDQRALNRVTGYVYIEDTTPGKTLKTEIINIEIEGSSGIIIAVPGLGGFGEKISQFRAKAIPLSQGFAHFSQTIKIPLKPMVGRIGTAPEDTVVPCQIPGPHGGNMDNNHITAGSRVYLPIYQEGALLAAGDLHACMGDGESIISGVEVYGTITLKCTAVDEPSVIRPLVATPHWVMTTAEGSTLEEAHKIALDDMANLLCNRLRIDYVEAAMLISVAGQLRICQIVNPKVGVKVLMPTDILSL